MTAIKVTVAIRRNGCRKALAKDGALEGICLDEWNEVEERSRHCEFRESGLVVIALWQAREPREGLLLIVLKVQACHHSRNFLKKLSTFNNKTNSGKYTSLNLCCNTPGVLQHRLSN